MPALMDVDVVIAVRGGGKSRLSMVLDEGRRAALVAVMLADMLDWLAGWRLHVLTPTAELADLARRVGAEVIEDAGGGLNPAFAAARAGLAARHPGAAFVALPGDLPLAAGSDLDAMLAVLRDGRPVLVPATRGGGTGAVALSPVTPFRFAFGPGSLDAHRAAANDAVLVDAPGLALDIDVPEDIADFLARARSGRTRALLLSGQSLAETRLDT